MDNHEGKPLGLGNDGGGEGVVMGGRNLWYIPYTEKGKMGNYTPPSEKAKLKGKHGNDSKAWKRKA